MADGDRQTAGRPSLHEATLVGDAGFSGVLVAEVDLHPGDLIAEPAQSGVDRGLDLTGEFVATLDVVIRIDLNLHGSSPLYGVIENRASRCVTNNRRDLESLGELVLLGADDLATLPQGEANNLIEGIVAAPASARGAMDSIPSVSVP